MRTATAWARGTEAEILGDGHPGDPDDLTGRRHDGQVMPQRAGHAAVGEQVLEGLGAIHAERPHAVALPPSAHEQLLAERLGVERRQVRARRLHRRRADLRANLPAPEAAAARDPQRDRLGCGVGLRGRHEADQPVLADRPHAVAEVERRHPPECAASRMISAARRRPSGTARPLARSASARSARRRRAGSEPGEGVGPDRHRAGAGAGGLERLQHHPLQELGVLDQLGLGLGDVPLGRRAQLAKHRQHLGAHSVAGEVELEVGLVVGERQACLGRQAARLDALERQQRPYDAAAAGPAGRGAPALPARRRGGRAPSRPGRFACGRWRSSCRRFAARSCSAAA